MRGCAKLCLPLLRTHCAQIGQTSGDAGAPLTSVKDPVCGMMVDTERAPAKSTYGGQTVYFCSTGCQKKHEASHGRK
jgi:Cu+-exporting ATPase